MYHHLVLKFKVVVSVDFVRSHAIDNREQQNVNSLKGIECHKKAKEIIMEE